MPPWVESDETCWGHANHIHIRCYRLLDYCLVPSGTNARIPAVHAVSIKVLETKFSRTLPTWPIVTVRVTHGALIPVLRLIPQQCPLPSTQGTLVVGGSAASWPLLEWCLNMWRMASVVCTEVPSHGILRFTNCVPLLVNLRVGGGHGWCACNVLVVCFGRTLFIGLRSMPGGAPHPWPCSLSSPVPWPERAPHWSVSWHVGTHLILSPCSCFLSVLGRSACATLCPLAPGACLVGALQGLGMCTCCLPGWPSRWALVMPFF